MELKSGDATFTIHVQFRQNASWQGTISWIQGNKTQRFRSELEMIKLMIDAMDYEKTAEGLVGWVEARNPNIEKYNQLPQRKTVAPQVKPAPKPAVTTISPFFT